MDLPIPEDVQNTDTASTDTGAPPQDDALGVVRQVLDYGRNKYNIKDSQGQSVDAVPSKQPPPRTAVAKYENDSNANPNPVPGYALGGGVDQDTPRGYDGGVLRNSALQPGMLDGPMGIHEIEAMGNNLPEMNWQDWRRSDNVDQDNALTRANTQIAPYENVLVNAYDRLTNGSNIDAAGRELGTDDIANSANSQAIPMDADIRGGDNGYDMGLDLGTQEAGELPGAYRKGGSVPGVNHYAQKTQRFEGGSEVVEPAQEGAQDFLSGLGQGAADTADAVVQSQPVDEGTNPYTMQLPQNAGGIPDQDAPAQRRRSIWSYLFGDAASAQEVAQAEAAVRAGKDQSQGDGIPMENEPAEPGQPGQKGIGSDAASSAQDVIAAAAKRDPEQGWRILQAYRRKYEMLRQSAAAAANHDPEHAAALATKAHLSVPDGYDIQFQPTGDGFTATVSKGGKPVSQHNMSLQDFQQYFRSPAAGFDNVMESTPSRTLPSTQRSQQPNYVYGQGAMPPMYGDDIKGDLTFKTQQDVAQFAQRAFPYNYAKQQEFIAKVMEKGGQEYPSAQEVAKNRADAMRDVAQVRGQATVASSENRAAGQIGAAKERKEGQIGAADVGGRWRNTTQETRNQGNLAVQGSRNEGNLAVAKERSRGNLDVQNSRNEGNLAVQGSRNEGNLAVQGSKNEGQLANTGLKNEGNLAVTKQRGQDRITQEGVRQSGQQGTAQIRSEGGQARERIRQEGQQGIATTRANAYRYNSDNRLKGQQYQADKRLEGTQNTNQTNLTRSTNRDQVLRDNNAANNQNRIVTARERNASNFARSVANPTGLPPTPQQFQAATGRSMQDYANPNGPQAPQQQAPAPQGQQGQFPPAPPLNQRQSNTVYQTRGAGPMRWTGTGWVRP